MIDPFYGTSGPHNAKIMVVGEAWGAEEDRKKLPLVGESGRLFDGILAEAGLDRRDLFLTNVVSARPPDNELFRWFHSTKDAKTRKETALNGLYPSGRIRSALDLLRVQVEHVNPLLIIGLGNYPLWALTNFGTTTNSTEPSGWKVPGGIVARRGSQLYTGGGALSLSSPYPFLPIIHPAAALRNWPYRPSIVHDLRVRVPLALTGRWERSPPVYQAPPTFRQVMDYFRLLDSKLRFGPVDLAADLETKGQRIITCIGLSHDGTFAISIPFIRVESGGISSYWSLNEEKAIVRRLRSILSHHNTRVIGQNFLYDCQFIGRWWLVRPRVTHDTLLAQHVLFPGTPKDLGYLASLYCTSYYRYWKEDSKEWEDTGDLATHLTYNCDDATYTWKIAQAQRRALVASGLTDQFAYIMRTFYLALNMMERGIRVDPEERKRMSLHVMDEAGKRQEWLRSVVPLWIIPPVGKTAKPWYQSYTQQATLLYESLGLKSQHHRKTGKVTADDAALHELSLRYPELSRLFTALIELRSLGVFQNNFLSAGLDLDSRMRSSYNPGGTETFRWSSSKNAFGRGANLQNIPKGGD